MIQKILFYKDNLYLLHKLEIFYYFTPKTQELKYKEYLQIVILTMLLWL